MKYLIPFITAGVGFLVGLLVCKRKKADEDTAPISYVDLLRIIEQVRRDTLENIEREQTIEKLRKRLGL